jgi:regulator of protease activity HflC (stomatin/prohibitin superfamily)
MKRIINLVCIAFLVLWMIPKLFVDRINPWEIGVRRSLTGGITEEDFGTGYHFALPIFHSFYRLPRTLRYLSFNGDDSDADAGTLEVRTKENNVLFVDVTIPWRIKKDAGWRIIREGFGDSYAQKVQSTAGGVLREGLAELTNLDVQQTDKRQATADAILPRLNTALEQYHVVADRVVIRAIRFRPEYEQKLQDKQNYLVQGRLDDARRVESVAIQATDTFEKGIDKNINLKRQEWNEKIESLKTVYELEIAAIDAEAQQYDKKRRSEGDAFYSEAQATGDLAEAKAEALGEKLKSAALASSAGRTFSAIQAAENFKLGNITLNSSDPTFLQKFGSMAAWRKFFLGGGE